MLPRVMICEFREAKWSADFSRPGHGMIQLTAGRLKPALRWEGISHILKSSCAAVYNHTATYRTGERNWVSIAEANHWISPSSVSSCSK
jgi:hypothetical protein